MDSVLPPIEARNEFPVIDEVEFDVASSSVFLKILFLLGKRLALASLENFEVGIAKGLSDLVCKGERQVESSFVIVVEKEPCPLPGSLFCEGGKSNRHTIF